jgi:hypothetical protein
MLRGIRFETSASIVRMLIRASNADIGKLTGTCGQG